MSNLKLFALGVVTMLLVEALVVGTVSIYRLSTRVDYIETYLEHLSAAMAR